MVVVRRRRGDIVIFLLDHLLVSIAFLDFVGVPMAVFVVGMTEFQPKRALSNSNPNG